MQAMGSEQLFGLKKFVNEYNSSFKSVAELQEKVARVIEKHRLELEKQKIESKRKRRFEDDDGWITVEKSDRHAFQAHKIQSGAIVKKKYQKPSTKFV